MFSDRWYERRAEGLRSLQPTRGPTPTRSGWRRRSLHRLPAAHTAAVHRRRQLRLGLPFPRFVQQAESASSPKPMPHNGRQCLPKSSRNVETTGPGTGPSFQHSEFMVCLWDDIKALCSFEKVARGTNDPSQARGNIRASAHGSMGLIIPPLLVIHR